MSCKQKTLYLHLKEPFVYCYHNSSIKDQLNSLGPQYMLQICKYRL